MRDRFRKLAAAGVVLLTAAALSPAPDAAAAEASRPSGGGLSADIRYTEYGIPHIVADDYPGLGFGVGWAQAADQACTLADGFVTLRGERSRYFGAAGHPDGTHSSASTNLASDLFFKGIRQTRTVEKLLRQPAPAGPGDEVKELMRGWAAGYNAWLAQRKITDPACAGKEWVKPVTALDVAANAYALVITAGQADVVDSLVAAHPPAAGAPPAPTAPQSPQKSVASVRSHLARDDGGLGSNAVAFRGDTSANGRGLLLGNPHYPWSGGRRFWQSQVTIPGELDVAGGLILGSPTPNIGHNARIAWSHTVSTGVPMNFHQLTLDPADPTAYLVDGKPERMTRRTVTVPVKDGPDVVRTQWWTRYGPVVTEYGGLDLAWTNRTAYAMSDPNAAQLRMSDTFLGLGKARNVADVRRVLRRTQGLPWVNTVAADSAGRTLYTQSQVVPRITDDLVERCSTGLGRLLYPGTGLAVLDGARSGCAPGRDRDAVQPGIFGPSAMPTLTDAPYAENSNDSAWLANADRPLTGYPRVLGDIGTPRSLRTRGAVEDVSALADRGDLTPADLQRQQFTNRVPAGDLAAADTARACAALPGGTATGSDGKAVDVSEACRVIAAWDRTVRTDSKGALLFDRFWRRLTATVPQTDLWKTPFDPDDPVRTPRTLNTAAPGLATALADAVSELRAARIPLAAPLGEHQFVVRNGKRIPVSGGVDGLGVWNMTVGRWNPASGGYTEVRHGSSYIQAVSFADDGCPVNARTLLTYSQSSNPRSPHYSDQTELYSAGRMIRSRFCERDVLASPQLRVEHVRRR